MSDQAPLPTCDHCQCPQPARELRTEFHGARHRTGFRRTVCVDTAGCEARWAAHAAERQAHWDGVAAERQAARAS